jgi:hypothetical protein
LHLIQKAENICKNSNHQGDGFLNAAAIAAIFMRIKTR